MKILSVETSCDETAIAIINAHGNPRKGDVSFDMLSNLVLSQVKLHAEYGGVYPALAKREHAKNLIPLLQQALAESNFLNVKRKTQNVKLQLKTQKEINKILEREPGLLKQFLEFIQTIEKQPIDAIAVTYGPGLEPALWVGINFAKALSLVWNIPIIPVNHMEGHIFSAMLKKSQNNARLRVVRGQADLTQNNAEKNKKLNAIRYTLYAPSFPILALLISGGHTELVLSKDWLQYEIVGETRDDAVGEAFDKVARMLGLPYPGGPAIAQKAEQWKQQITKNKSQINSKFKIQNSKFRLPRPMIDSGDFDFSFSGIKTAVLYRLKEIKKLTPLLVQEFSYEFEEAVTEVIVKKTTDAALRYGAKTIIVGGGVSANTRIRDALVGEARIKNQESRIFFPPQELTTDNALMIGVAGYIRSAIIPNSLMLPPQSGLIKAVGTLKLK